MFRNFFIIDYNFLQNLMIGQFNIFQLILCFFIYSFLGWCMECIVIRYERGFWENRGFSKAPFCIIYGFGALIALKLFEPFQDNLILLFIICSVSASIFEFVTAKIMIMLFGSFWWDYTNHKFNYKGILCLESTVGWGFVGVFIFKFLHPLLVIIILKLNPIFVTFLSIFLMLEYFLDFSYNFYVNYHKNK